MSTQTKAERLADTLDVEIFVTMEDLKQSAAELRRLEADNDDLKAEILEQCRINGMGAEREDALRAEIDRLKKAAQQAQPAREWVGMTQNERSSIVNANTTSDCGYDTWVDGNGVARAIEAKLKEKNT